jgi:aryl-alcohol dehydrogenase-like predicted oxidoreductase
VNDDSGEPLRARAAVVGRRQALYSCAVELRRLADSGIEVSPIGLGCNNFGRVLDLAETRAVIDATLDAGINFVDTAERYGDGDSERFIGESLRGRRSRVVLATKFGGGPPGGRARGTAAYIHTAVETSLARLRTDYVDLLYYHAPDGVTPIAETLEALHDLVGRGVARAIGCSNFGAEQLAEADDVARSAGLTRFVALQNQYSLLERDADVDVIPLCRKLDVAFVAYFPLANGVLTGKYERGAHPPQGTRLARWGGEILSDATFDRIDELNAFAEHRGRTLHELAVAAVVSTPGVASALTGATSPEQVRANAAVDWELSADELSLIPRVEGLGVHGGRRRS